MQNNNEHIAARPPEFEIAYAAYRHAKAALELATYAPDIVNGDLPEEIGKQLGDASLKALHAVLLFPVEKAAQLVRKLRIFRDEELWTGFPGGAEVIDQMVRDAARIAFPGDKA